MSCSFNFFSIKFSAAAAKVETDLRPIVGRHFVSIKIVSTSKKGSLDDIQEATERQKLLHRKNDSCLVVGLFYTKKKKHLNNFLDNKQYFFIANVFVNVLENKKQAFYNKKIHGRQKN